jgi:hypothetical protein
VSAKTLISPIGETVRNGNIAKEFHVVQRLANSELRPVATGGPDLKKQSVEMRSRLMIGFYDSRPTPRHRKSYRSLLLVLEIALARDVGL